MSNLAESGVVIFALDLPRVARFYQEVLGLPAVEQGPHHVVLGGPRCQVIVHAIPAEIAATITLSSPPQRREESALKPFFPVASLAAARASADGLGGLVDPPEREWTAGGLRACDGHDPEGNVLQLREPAG